MKIFSSSLILFALLVWNHTYAQLIVSNDTTICAGQSVQLSVSGGTTYIWNNANTLSSSTSDSPVATPTQTTTYIVSSPLSSVNLAPNPDFSQGNTGFSSSYTYEIPTNILGSGSYFVGGNANHWNPGMSVLCGDHTSGVDTNMLIANAALTSPTPVWCVTLNVAPNSTYSLSGYFTCFSQTNLPKMQWMVNGTPIGSSASSFFQCLWNPFNATWNSGNNTTATFCIFDPLTIGNGNDFALDDISITGSGTWYDTVTITVLNPPVVNLGNDTSLCGSGTITLNAQNPGSVFLWNDNSTQQTLSVNSSGNYSVTVTNSNTCSASSSINISASSAGNAVISSPRTQLCSNDTAQICVSGSFASYLWNTNATTSCIAATEAGNYYVTVTDQNGCTAESNHLGISVFPSPPVSVSVNGDTLSSFNAVAYQWYLNGNFINGATSNIYVANETGNYSVQVTDSNGCKAFSTSIPVVTGIKELNSTNGVSIYPNPNSLGNWQLEVCSDWVGSKVEISDANGKLVFKSEIRNQKSEIVVGDKMPSGVYLICINSKQKNYTAKLIKQ